MAMTFSGDEFAKALSEGTLKEPINLHGMVKHIEGEETAILFSQGTSCELWTRIPVAMIDSVHVEAMVPCHDHRHPFVTITLKQPHDDNEEANVFVSLLQSANVATVTPDYDDNQTALDPEPWYIHKSRVQAYSCFCSQTRDEGRNWQRLSGSYPELFTNRTANGKSHCVISRV